MMEILKKTGKLYTIKLENAVNMAETAVPTSTSLMGATSFPLFAM